MQCDALAIASSTSIDFRCRLPRAPRHCRHTLFEMTFSTTRGGAPGRLSSAPVAHRENVGQLLARSCHALTVRVTGPLR